MYFEVPDSTPTPAPYVVSSSDTETDAAESDGGLGGASSTIVSRSTSFDDDSAYFRYVNDDGASSDRPDNGGVSASSSTGSADGGVGASPSPESDDGGVGTSSSSALGTVSTGGGATSGPLPWTFTVIAVGAVSSMLSRATGMLQA